MTATESIGGDAATTTVPLLVSVAAIADAPVLTVQAASGDEDSAIALNIAAALNDIDGSELLSDVTIGGIPLGAMLSAGTLNPDGTATLTPAQLTGLTVTPPPDSDVALPISCAGDGHMIKHPRKRWRAHRRQGHQGGYHHEIWQVAVSGYRKALPSGQQHWRNASG